VRDFHDGRLPLHRAACTAATADRSMRIAIGVLATAAFVFVFGASFAGTILREPLATAAYVTIVLLAIAMLGTSIADRKKP
jgi:hypothetical protein